MIKLSNNVQLKQKVIAITMLIVAVLLTAVGTYAFFTSNATTTNQEAVVKTGSMALIFRDGDEGVSASLKFGDTVTKTFEIENEGTLEAKISMNFLNLINTYTRGSLTYTLSESTTEIGQYTAVVSDKNVPVSTSRINRTLASDLTIGAKSTKYYRLVITYNHLDTVDQNSDVDAVLNTKFILGEAIEEKTIGSEIKKLSKGTVTDFDTPTMTAEQSGVYEMEDDYGTSYYYRGAVENNYVKFAGFYWRIIRLNGDGSVRIIYDGTSAHANGDNSIDRFTHTSQAWNSAYNDNKYVGWMYGPAGTTASTEKSQIQANTTNSEIKTVVDEWYKTNIEDAGYGSAVSDEIFCNDRSTPGKAETGWSYDMGLGYGKNKTAFGAAARTGVWNSSTTKSAPTFKCPEKEDAFTTTDVTKGNGALTYPVGLITADEVVAAGSGKYASANSNYYLYRRNWYWSLSPNSFYGTFAGVFNIYTNGYLYDANVHSAGAVAPVINLSPEYVETMTGEGTMESPYEAK